MSAVTGDRYLESLVRFVDKQAGPLIEGTLVLKVNPVGLHYVQSRLEALNELNCLLDGAPVDYLRAYVSDLGDHRALQQLQRILRLLTSLKVESVLPPPARDPTPLSLLPFGRLKVLELRGCDLSTSAARGLLELRHTLEKIICHNSTDALRHVFASRITEIKDSPQWNRLSFVSCACNGLVLMDESLQLLSAAETLDLSRNKFTKVDNLRKCTKLKHLDLGFNHLRTIASLYEVPSHIVKLVLRNNALVTLRGIENLKSLEGLDVSFNIISNFSELEVLADLPSLRSLWLEGNPLCCSRWYRPQVFSFFSHPDKLKLDEKNICAIEFWKRKIILASRHTQPASYGFYSPAKNDPDLEGTVNTKRKKLSRLAWIENEEQSIHIYSDQETVSCDHEIQNTEENIVPDEEAEIVDLINRIEFMKKERSSLWLQEFKEWMNQEPEDSIETSHYSFSQLNPGRKNYLRNKPRFDHVGESSRYVSDSVQASGDESSTNVLDSDNSFVGTSLSLNVYQFFDQNGEAGPKFIEGCNVRDSLPVMERMVPQPEHIESHANDKCPSLKANNSNINAFEVTGDVRTDAKQAILKVTSTGDVPKSNSSLACQGSPPQYKEDILHRRHNLVEEFLQLSAESYSVASSDSDTSNSDNDSTEYGPSVPHIEKFRTRSMDGHSSILLSENIYPDQRHECPHITPNSSLPEQISCTPQPEELHCSQQLSINNLRAGACNDDRMPLVVQEYDLVEKKKCRRKLKRRVVSMSENTMDSNAEQSAESNCNLDVQKFIDDKRRSKSVIATSLKDGSSPFQSKISIQGYG